MSVSAFSHDLTEHLQYSPQIRSLSLVKHSVDDEDKDNSSERGFTFIYVRDGRFEWKINRESIILLPRDFLVVSAEDEVDFCYNRLEYGHYYKLSLNAQNVEDYLAKYSRILKSDQRLIIQLFALSSPLIIQDYAEGEEIMIKIYKELERQEVAYKSKLSLLIENFIVNVSRELTRLEVNTHDFPKSFSKLDKLLRENLSHPWSVNEMASIVGLKVTSFTEKIKFYTGFAPVQYLINLRIAEAIRLIKSTNLSMTQIALETGFYSSQHFSSSFKKITGFSPKNFRKNG